MRTDEFHSLYGDEPFELLCEALYAENNVDRLSLIELTRTDVINSEGLAIYTTPDGGEVVFSFSDGNVNGTRITNFGEGDWEYVTPKTATYIYVPASGLGEAKRKRALRRCNSPQVVEMGRRASYDLFMKPTTETRNYYAERFLADNLVLECV